MLIRQATPRAHAPQASQFSRSLRAFADLPKRSDSLNAKIGTALLRARKGLHTSGGVEPAAVSEMQSLLTDAGALAHSIAMTRFPELPPGKRVVGPVLRGSTVYGSRIEYQDATYVKPQWGQKQELVDSALAVSHALNELASQLPAMLASSLVPSERFLETGRAKTVVTQRSSHSLLGVIRFSTSKQVLGPDRVVITPAFDVVEGVAASVRKNCAALSGACASLAETGPQLVLRTSPSRAILSEY